MKFEADFIKWLNEWENPRDLDTQNLTEYEWDFLVSLKKRYIEFFNFKVCPAVDSDIKESRIRFGEDENTQFSARKHLFINSIDLTKLKEKQEWEIAYANRLDYTIIHVSLAYDEIKCVNYTF